MKQINTPTGMKQVWMTPAQLAFLLYCHVHPDPHPLVDSGTIKGAIAFLRETKCIVAREERNTYSTTPKGAAWIKAICMVPPPKTAYVDQNNEVLHIDPT